MKINTTQTNLTSAKSITFLQVFYYYHKASEHIFDIGSPHQNSLCLRCPIYAGPIPRWPHEVKILTAMTPGKSRVRIWKLLLLVFRTIQINQRSNMIPEGFGLCTAVRNQSVQRSLKCTLV